MTADVAQHENSSIKRYASTFSNIQIKLCYTRLSSKAPQGQSSCQKTNTRSVECMVCKRDNSDGLVFDSIGYVSNHIEARNVSKIRNKIGCYSHNLYPVLASEHAHKLFYFFEKKLIIYIYYNLILLHFSITKYLEV